MSSHRPFSTYFAFTALTLTLPPVLLYLYTQSTPSPTLPPRAQKQKHTIHLPTTNTKCTYTDIGAQENPTILYIHGTPGSNIIPIIALKTMVEKWKVRILFVKREKEDANKIRKYAQKLKEFLEMKNVIEEVAIVAVGEGVVYALALLDMLPPKSLRTLNVSSIYLVSPPSPMIKRKYIPRAALRVYYHIFPPAAHPSEYLSAITSPTTRPEVEPLIISNIFDTFAEGTEQYADEMHAVYYSEWPLSLSDVAKKGVPFHIYSSASTSNFEDGSAKLAQSLRAAGGDVTLIDSSDERWTVLESCMSDALRVIGTTGGLPISRTPQARSRVPSARPGSSLGARPVSISPSRLDTALEDFDVEHPTSVQLNPRGLAYSPITASPKVEEARRFHFTAIQQPAADDETGNATPKARIPSLMHQSTSIPGNDLLDEPIDVPGTSSLDSVEETPAPYDKGESADEMGSLQVDKPDTIETSLLDDEEFGDVLNVEAKGDASPKPQSIASSFAFIDKAGEDEQTPSDSSSPPKKGKRLKKSSKKNASRQS